MWWRYSCKCQVMVFLKVLLNRFVMWIVVYFWLEIGKGCFFRDAQVQHVALETKTKLQSLIHSLGPMTWMWKLPNREVKCIWNCERLTADEVVILVATLKSSYQIHRLIGKTCSTSRKKIIFQTHNTFYSGMYSSWPHRTLKDPRMTFIFKFSDATGESESILGIWRVFYPIEIHTTMLYLA